MKLTQRITIISLSLCVLLSNTSTAKAAIEKLTCSENGTAVLYTNGVLTSEEEAKRTLRYIQELDLDSSIDINSDVFYDYKYNTSQSGLQDFFEAAVQAIAQELGPEEQYANYSAIMAGVKTVSLGLGSVLGSLVRLGSETSPLVADTSALAQLYIDAMADDLKILAISHSQGAFFVNAAYQQAVAQGPDKFNPKLFSALQIATPASGIASPNGTYRTWIKDVVRFVPGALPSNIFDDISLPGLFQPLSVLLGHAINEVYLAVNHPEYEPIRAQVIEGIHKAALKLGSSCRGCENPLTGKSQPGDLHQNPDGSIGGFVADTATVDSSSHIDPEGQVCDHAAVYDYSTIWRNTTLRDNAKVAHYSTVGDSVIAGNTIVYNDAMVIASTLDGDITFQGDSYNPTNWNTYIGTVVLPHGIANGPVIRGRANLYLANIADNVSLDGSVDGRGITVLAGGLSSQFPGASMSMTDNSRFIRSFANGNFHLSGDATVVHSLITGDISQFSAASNAMVENLDSWQSKISVPSGYLRFSYYVSQGPLVRSSTYGQVCAPWLNVPDYINHCASGPKDHGGSYVGDLTYLPSSGPTAIPPIPELGPVELPLVNVPANILK